MYEMSSERQNHACGAALDAHRHLPGAMEECSDLANWTSLLLRRYVEPQVVDAFETLPTPNQLLVLVKSGSTRIESLRVGRHRCALYVPGDLGLTAPNETSRLRWRGREQQTTLQLHLPERLLLQAADDLGVRRSAMLERLDALSNRDPFIVEAILALERGAARGYSELYAESAAHLLALHLLSRDVARYTRPGQDPKLFLLEEYLLANLAHSVSLKEMAAEVGWSPFQLIRAAKRGWGMTPFSKLTQIRMEHAQRLFAEEGMNTLAVALACGYTNPSHFALAFRRVTGVSPRAHRAAEALSRPSR